MYRDLCSQLAQVQTPTFLLGDFGQDASLRLSCLPCLLSVTFNAWRLNK